MKGIVIFGAGGLAREVHELIEDIIDQGRDEWEVLGFLDEDDAQWGSRVRGTPILGGQDWLLQHPSTYVVVAIGNAAVRQRIVSQLMTKGHRLFATLIHPKAMIGRRVQVGDGTVLFQGSVVTTDVRIGNHVIVHYNATVSHDTVLADYVTIGPGVNLAGAVQVGEGCDFGIRSAAIPGVVIGSWTVVGAGAVITRDLPRNVTAAGIPAMPIRRRAEGWQANHGQPSGPGGSQ